MATYTILNDLRGTLESKLDKIARKGGSFTLAYDEPFFMNGYEYVSVHVEGNYKISGWEFVASLEWDDNANTNIVKSIPGVEIPSMYFNRCECDHCKSSRYRKYTVILRNCKDGSFIQVGKGCLKDYLGYDAEGYASYLAFFSTVEEYIDTLNKDFLPRAKKFYEVKDILEQTVEQVKRHGYVTRKMVNESEDVKSSTASVVWHIVNRDTYFDGTLIQPYYEVSDSTKDVVSTIFNLVNSAEEDNGYVHNIKALLKSDYVEGDKVGLVSSAYSFYVKNINENKEDKVPSEYIGNVGDRIEFTAIPKCVYSYETDYGWNYIYKFQDGDNIIIWKTSKALDDVETTFKATVKAHNEYKGIKQTEVTRAKEIARSHKEEEEQEPANEEVNKALDEFFAYFEQ